MPTYFLKLTEAVLDEATGQVTLQERSVYIPAEARLILPRLRGLEHITFDEYGLRKVEYLAHPDPPVLDVLEPSEALVGTEWVTMICRGDNFAPGAVIVFNNSDEPTQWVSPQEISTGIEPSTASGPATVPVYVRNPDGEQSDPLDFTFTAPPPLEEE
jgi:hypothetical protein